MVPLIHWDIRRRGGKALSDLQIEIDEIRKTDFAGDGDWANISLLQPAEL